MGSILDELVLLTLFGPLYGYFLVTESPYLYRQSVSMGLLSGGTFLTGDVPKVPTVEQKGEPIQGENVVLFWNLGFFMGVRGS